MPPKGKATKGLPDTAAKQNKGKRQTLRRRAGPDRYRSALRFLDEE